MMKNFDSLEFVERAGSMVEELLDRVPGIQPESLDPSTLPNTELDLVYMLNGQKMHRHGAVLGIECKSSGQLRIVKAALEKLMSWSSVKERKVPLIFAPYLPPDSRRLIAEAGCNYADLAGNARLHFGQVFIERESATVPKQIRRELRSIYMPRSALVLKALLGQVGREWKLSDLAAETGVSLGQLSNVLKALEQRDWMERRSGSNVLTKPDALIDEWAAVYEGLAGVTHQYYTVHHGKKFDALLKGVLRYEPDGGRNLVLSSYSAAAWISPFARQSDRHFLAQRAALKDVLDELNLERVEEGGNIFITVPDDLGSFYGTIEAAPNIFTTSPLQTYLDLLTSGERAQEAAQHLRRTTRLWKTE